MKKIKYVLNNYFFIIFFHCELKIILVNLSNKTEHYLKH